MKALKKMNLAELTTELNRRAGTKVKKAKGKKAEIIAKIEALPAVKDERREKKRGPSTKTVIRELFKNKKSAFTMAEILAKCSTVKANTVETAIVDLKNPKWAAGPVLKILRGEDNKYRVSS
jgi:hypothetical protein